MAGSPEHLKIPWQVDSSYVKLLVIGSAIKFPDLVERFPIFEVSLDFFSEFPDFCSTKARS